MFSVSEEDKSAAGGYVYMSMQKFVLWCAHA